MRTAAPRYRNVLPPGANGHADITQLGAFVATGSRPPHNDDQLSLYARPRYATPGLTAERPQQVLQGLRASACARATSGGTYSPRDDVVIVRDKSFGVPHIYGDTRDGAMFGAGYTAARGPPLLHRRAAPRRPRPSSSTFAGGAGQPRDGPRRVDSSRRTRRASCSASTTWPTRSTARTGRQLQLDVDNYVAGINAYIDEAKLNPLQDARRVRGDREAAGPEPWKVTDVIATASLVGGIFGKGGGSEVASAVVLERARGRFGRKRGPAGCGGLPLGGGPGGADDGAPRRARSRTSTPRAPTTAAAALPDKGSLDAVRSWPARGRRQGATPRARSSRRSTCPAASRACSASRRRRPTPCWSRPRSPSRPSARGVRPAGRLLRARDPDGAGPPRAQDRPGPRARRARRLLPGHQPLRPARPRARLLLERHLGRPGHHRHLRGDLCEPGGGKPTTAVAQLHVPRAVRADGRARAHQLVEPDGCRLHARRARDAAGAAHEARARGGPRQGPTGKPVAYTKLRSTYFHEVDSAIGFSEFNDPD